MKPARIHFVSAKTEQGSIPRGSATRENERSEFRRYLGTLPRGALFLIPYPLFIIFQRFTIQINTIYPHNLKFRTKLTRGMNPTHIRTTEYTVFFVLYKPMYMHAYYTI